MQVKNELRKKYKEIRKNVENRNEKNTLINDFLCNSDYLLIKIDKLDHILKATIN